MAIFIEYAMLAALIGIPLLLLGFRSRRRTAVTVRVICVL
jgi:hypothetical protein